MRAGGWPPTPTCGWMRGDRRHRGAALGGAVQAVRGAAAACGWAGWRRREPMSVPLFAIGLIHYLALGHMVLTNTPGSGHLLERPVDGAAADPQRPGDLGHGYVPVLIPRPGQPGLLRGELGRTAAEAAAGPRGRPAYRPPLGHP